VKAKGTIHVLTDKKGTIVGGGILTPAKDHKGKPVYIQITPMKGQSVTEVGMPAEIGKLEGAEFFRRLQSDYHLPRGKKELVRKAGRR
jgi:hypothetical protein